MPKDYKDVALEYDSFKEQHPDDPTDFGSFAHQMDVAQGTPGERSSAYNPGFFKNASVGIDKLFDFTHLPQAAGGLGELVGGGIDSVAGTHTAPVLQKLGEQTPRMITEGLLTAPETASVAGAPLAAATMANRARILKNILGYGDAAIQGYTATDSPVGAAVNAATLGTFNKVVPMAGEAGADAVRGWLGKAAPEVGDLAYKTASERILPSLGNLAGAGAATAGINEVSRQAMMSVGPNSVPLTDFKDRNPFTEENVVSDIAAILPHAVQVGGSVLKEARGSGFAPKNINEWMKAQTETPDSLPQLSGVQETTPPNKEFSTAISESPLIAEHNEPLQKVALKTYLDKVSDLRARGDEAGAMEWSQRAVDLVNQMGTTKPTIPTETIVENAPKFDSLAREQPPETVVGFQKFVQDVNAHIEALNENTTSFTEEQKNKASLGETWHPNARDPSVVQRLQGKGLVEKITPEWLAENFHATFNETGNPDFSYQVTLQKVANRLLDAVPIALEKEKTLPVTTETPISPRVQAINQTEHDFITALTGLPESIKDAAIQKTVDVSKADNAPSKSYYKGRQLNQMSSWRQAVMQATKSYDPATNTILLKKGGEFRRVPAASLLKFEPYASPVKMGEGGKSSTERTNLEGRVRGGENVVPTPEDLSDEAGFAKALAEEGMPGADLPTAAGEEIAKPEVDLGKGQEEVKVDAGLSEKLTKQAGKLSKTIDALDDKQLYTLAKSSFDARLNDPRATGRATILRSALKAALENYGKSGEPGPAGAAFLQARTASGVKLGEFTPKKQLDLQLRDFFGKDFNDPKGKVAQIVNKLLDDKNIQLLIGKSLAREGDSLVEFSGPVRLRRWLEKPTGGLTPDAKGELPTKSVPALLAKLGIGKDEMALYKSLGLDDFLSRSKVGAQELATWMDKHTPQVETKKLVPQDAQNNGMQALHELETLGYTMEDSDEYFGAQMLNRDGETVSRQDPTLSPRVQELLRIVDSVAKGEGDPDTDAATGRYGVEPKELKDMPGAVDILVRLPQRTIEGNNLNGQPTYGGREAPLYRGPHFGDSDKNVLASVRGYVETLPSGDKVFHVFEVQSDWGQKVATLKQAGKEQGEIQHSTLRENLANINKEKLKIDHPLLAVYEQLALKAAITHAREIGAKYVALSDAETAMMTEGHDRHVQFPPIGEGRENARANYISQEPGMRAAYDVRLPDTMLKLTGEKGQMVDFGVHKTATGFDEYTPNGPGDHRPRDRSRGSPVFNNKTSVTARLYDISKAPEKFSAFGYSLPKYGSTTVDGAPLATEPGAAPDLLTNKPASGAFTGDVESAVTTLVNKYISEKGYGGTFRKLFVEASRKIAEAYGKDIPLDLYDLKEPGVAGRALATEGRGAVGINFGEAVRQGNEQFAIRQLIGTLQHELAHIDDFVRRGLIDAPDAYSYERLRQMNNLNSLGETLSPEQRHGILSTLSDALFPPEHRSGGMSRENPKLLYGSQSAEEFIAEVSRMTADSLMYGKDVGKKSVRDVLDFGPIEVNEYMHGSYRSLRDIIDAASQTIEHPSVRAALGAEQVVPGGTDPKVLAHAFRAVLAAAEEGSKLSPVNTDLKQMRASTATLSEQAAMNPPVYTKSTWYRAESSIKENFPHIDMDSLAREGPAEAIQSAHEALVGNQKIKEGLWMSWFAPFMQRMTNMERSGVPLAGPIRILAENLQTGVTRLRSGILAPMLKVSDDGRIHLDQESPLVEFMNTNKTGAGRDALNVVREWQQRHDAQSMFVLDPKTGQITVNNELKGASTKWDSVKSKLSKENQQLLMGASVAMDKVGQLGAERMVAAIDMNNRFSVAGLLQTMNPKMTYDQAKGVADQVVGSMMTGDNAKLATLVAPEQMAHLQNLLGGDDGLLAKFGQLKDLLLNRPGWSTESLTGDYIVRFANPENETKFLSADSAAKAKALSTQLVREGNTMLGDPIHKNDLRQFTDFDNPDTLLQKFTEVEQGAWRKVMSSFEQQYGPDAAEALKVYSPGVASLKDISIKGMNKFLQKRETRVDTSRYDYMDGMMNWVNRLSSSLSYKLTNAEKNLVLNDPRAKQFPEFKQLVDTHFDNMMSPTGETTKQLKTLAGAYFLGGSLASAVINGTQSVVSLVPILIQMSKQGMGPVGAYASLGKAIGKVSEFATTSDWQRVAKGAEMTDPAKWSLAQAQAALYKRSLMEGGITQGIIQGDVLSGTDQNTLFNAQFGHGKYAEVTKTDMAKNGAYLAAQLSLKPFGYIESFNNKLSLFTGIEQGYKEGLRGEELYNYARQIKTLSTYGGGKANAPGFVAKASTPYTRSAVGIATTLQQYGFGTVTEYASMIRDSLGKNPTLSPMERRQAMKSLGTLMMTQVAIGGALGLPFAAATLAILEKTFGIQANAAVRQGLASLGQDDEQGSVIAETALNGLGNQMLGLDVSSRVGVSNILGTSAYRGFNLADLAGPVGSIVSNAATALNMFGQNEPGKAMTALVPQAFKNIMAMSDSHAKYGDSGLRDQSGNLLYTPTPSQAAAYMIGFRPRELSQRQNAQSLLTLADQQATAQHNRVQEAAAQSLLSGDAGPARSLAYGARDADYTMHPQDIYGQIINKAVDSSTEKDLLASGPSYNEQERQKIVGTYQPDVTVRQSEIERTLLRAQLAARVGAPQLMPDGAAYRRAAVIDSLVKSSGMPRSQASRLVSFLKM